MVGLEFVRESGLLDPQILRSELSNHSGELLQMDHAVRAANQSARAGAAARLAIHISRESLDRFGRYFEDCAVFPWTGAGPPDWGLKATELFEELAGTPRTVLRGGETRGCIELRSTDGAVDAEALGNAIEPESDTFAFRPDLLQQAAQNNISIGVRHFDRQFPRWTQTADDVAALTGADVFIKLFVTAGRASVTGWHRDQSDVIATMLWGRKRFAVAPLGEQESGSPTAEIDVVLTPGDVLVLPRSRLHCATPVGELAALLSIGVLRYGDWSYRSAIPTHLGFSEYPRSAAAYRLLLRPHVPAALPNAALLQVAGAAGSRAA